MEGLYALLGSLLGFATKWLLDSLTVHFGRDEREAAQRISKLEHAIELANKIPGEVVASRYSAIDGVHLEDTTTRDELIAVLSIWAPTLVQDARALNLQVANSRVMNAQCAQDVVGAADAAAKIKVVEAYQERQNTIYGQILLSVGQLTDAAASLARDNLPTARPSPFPRVTGWLRTLRRPSHANSDAGRDAAE